MRKQANCLSRSERGTLLVAPLGWDCFGLIEDSENFEPLPQAFHESESDGRSYEVAPKINSVRVRTVY